MKIQITVQNKGESRIKKRTLNTKANKESIIGHLNSIKQLLRNDMANVHTTQVVFANDKQEEVIICTL